MLLCLLYTLQEYSFREEHFFYSEIKIVLVIKCWHLVHILWGLYVHGHIKTELNSLTSIKIQENMQILKVKYADF